MSLEVAAHFACQTGENPRICPLDGAVFWTDIPRGLIFRMAPGDQAEIVYRGPVVGGFAWNAREKSWILARERDVVWWNGAEVRPFCAFDDADCQRFNDAIFDSQGRLWAGAIGAHQNGAGLFCIEPDGKTRRVCGQTKVSNGIAFSPDERQIFWTDSTHRQLRVAEFEGATGDLENERLLAQMTDVDGPEHGMPDGLIWHGGALLSCRNKGWGVARHDPRTGDLLDFYPFPVAKITALCEDENGGFWVTSGGGDGQNTARLDGALFRWRPDWKA